MASRVYRWWVVVPECQESIEMRLDESGESGPWVKYEDHEFECERLREALPDDIRAAGWTVAVHNDYRLNGESHTFWLFTKGDRAIKGEGRTDAEALGKVRTLLSNTTSPEAPELTELFCVACDMQTQAGLSSFPLSAKFRNRINEAVHQAGLRWPWLGDVVIGTGEYVGGGPAETETTE